MTISEDAVTAAAKALYADNMSNHSGDNAPQIIDACEKVARKILEAAAPHLLTEAATAGDLDSLPVGSIVLDSWGVDWRKTSKGIDGDNWDSSTTTWPRKVGDIELPAQVIYTEAVK